ncbi:unnamed protein product, partial [Amoebophrya sp. A120]
QKAAVRKKQRIRMVWASFRPALGPRKRRNQNPPFQRRTEGQKMRHCDKKNKKNPKSAKS